MLELHRGLIIPAKADLLAHNSGCQVSDAYIYSHLTLQLSEYIEKDLDVTAGFNQH
jgi:hypothetical protein